MNFEHFIRELQQIQLIQKKLIDISNNQERQKPHQAIDNVESLNNIITELVDDVSSNKVESMDEFVTMLNHELRTPLVPIMAYAEMLSQEKFGKLSLEQKKKIDMIISNTKQLQQQIGVLINKNTFESRTDLDATTNHNMREIEQKNLLLETINKLLSTKTDVDNQKMKTLSDSFAQSEHKQKELEQERLVIKNIMKSDEKKIQRLTKKHYMALAVIAVVVSAGFVAYSQYQEQVLFNTMSVMLKNYNSQYVIQNLQGDIVNTWVAWSIPDSRILHVSVINTANLSQDKIDAIKDAILSTKTVTLDDSLLGKGPKGTSSVYYTGWEGALTDAYSQHTTSYIPQKFDISGSPSASGDIVIILTNDVNPDGLSGFTKSLADGNQILKSKITIYRASELSAVQLEAITRHEFGHAMGLAHSTASEDLMHATIQTDYPYISGCDIDAIVGLYDGKQRSEVICKKVAGIKKHYVIRK